MRAGTALVAILLALPLAGCGDDVKITGGGQVVGDTMTVYSLLPLQGPRAEVARGVVLGEKLALAQANGLAGGRVVNYVSLDVSRRDGRTPAEKVASAARDAIHDLQMVAVITDLSTETAQASVPLFNAAGILQTSAGATYPGFVAPVEGGADPHAPGRYQPSRRRTFAPILPTDAAQAVAIARAARGPVAIEEEASDAGRALAAALRDQVGQTVATERARTFVYAGESAEDALGVVRAVAGENPRARIILPHALWATDLPERLPPGVARRVAFITAAGPPDEDFAADYRRRFGRAPGRLSYAGYTAMRAVLGAIDRAGGRAKRRRAVIDAFFADDPLERAAAEPFWRVAMRGGEARYIGPIRS